jgi:hypothetical protein
MAQDFVTIQQTGGDLEDDRSGSHILLASSKSYKSLNSYVGRVDVTAKADYPGNVSNAQSAQVKVIFAAPTRIRLEGLTRWTPWFSPAFVVIADGEEIWESLSVQDSGAFRRGQSIRETLLTFEGVYCGMTTMLPAILLDISWSAEHIGLPRGRWLDAFATRAVLDGEEAVGANACYRIVCEREAATWTLWVDRYTNMIRRIKQERSTDQVQKYGAGFSGRIIGLSITETHHVDGTDREIDMSVFRKPEGARE